VKRDDRNYAKASGSVLDVLMVAAAMVFASLPSENGTETAAKVGGVVAVIEAKAG
jgi:hypothetical protein